MVATDLSLLARMFDFLSQQPTAQEIVAMKTTQAEEDRWDYLDSRKGDEAITADEEEELKEFLLAQHLMVIAKANALGKLQISKG